MQEKCPLLLVLWRSRKLRWAEPLLSKHELILFLLTSFRQPLSVYTSFRQDACNRKKVVANGQLDVIIVLLPLGLNFLQPFGLLFCLLPLQHPVALWPLLNPVGTNCEGDWPLLLAAPLPAGVTVLS